MIELSWNRAVGKSNSEIQSLDFPDDPEKLAEIFMMIERGDFSFLGEFYSRFGPDITFKPGIADEKLRIALIIYGRKSLESMVKDELLAIEAWKDLEKVENVYKMHMEDWYQIYRPFIRYNLKESVLLRNMLEDGGVHDAFKHVRNVYSSLKELREKIESFIKETMEKCCPNITSVAGPILGAELLSIAGGLENLSSMPSSRIQILGAGKAFFISKKKNLPGPKHGVIFKHPFVHNSKNRGKNARILAGKIAIAARIDNFSGKLDQDFIDKNKKIFSK